MKFGYILGRKNILSYDLILIFFYNFFGRWRHINQFQPEFSFNQ